MRNTETQRIESNSGIVLWFTILCCPENLTICGNFASYLVNTRFLKTSNFFKRIFSFRKGYRSLLLIPPPFSLKTKKSACNLEGNFFFFKQKPKTRGKYCTLSFLYPPAYVMWIIDTLKLQAIYTFLTPKKQCCDAWIIYL